MTNEIPARLSPDCSLDEEIAWGLHQRYEELPLSEVEHLWVIATERKHRRQAQARARLATGHAAQVEQIAASVLTRVRDGYKHQPHLVPFELLYRLREIEASKLPCRQLASDMIRAVIGYYSTTALPAGTVEHVAELIQVYRTRVAEFDQSAARRAPDWWERRPRPPFAKWGSEYRKRVSQHAKHAKRLRRRTPLNPHVETLREALGPNLGELTYEMWPAVHALMLWHVFKEAGLSKDLLETIDMYGWQESVGVATLGTLDAREEWRKKSVLLLKDAVAQLEETGGMENWLVELARDLLRAKTSKAAELAAKRLPEIAARLSRTFIPSLSGARLLLVESVWRDIKHTKPRGGTPRSTFQSARARVVARGEKPTLEAIDLELDTSAARQRHRAVDPSTLTEPQLAEAHGLHVNAVKRARLRLETKLGHPLKGHNEKYLHLGPATQQAILHLVTTRALVLGRLRKRMSDDEAVHIVDDVLEEMQRDGLAVAGYGLDDRATEWLARRLFDGS